MLQVLFASIDPALRQTYWAMGVMGTGFLICALAGLTEMKSRTLKQEFPSIWKMDRWHTATVILGIVGILTFFCGFWILIVR